MYNIYIYIYISAQSAGGGIPATSMAAAQAKTLKNQHMGVLTV